MIYSLLIGLTAGARALTPLACVCAAARKAGGVRGGGFGWLGRTPLASGAVLLALGELFGDKLKSAPDRIVPAGLLARMATGGIAGAALAPKGRFLGGGLAGAGAAVAAAYATFALRRSAMRRFGQKSTGAVEDVLTLAAAQLIVSRAARSRSGAV